jgi:hypothetical protein
MCVRVSARWAKFRCTMRASSEPGCSRDQKQPCPDDDGPDGSRDALTGRCETFDGDGCRHDRHRAKVHDPDDQLGPCACAWNESAHRAAGARVRWRRSVPLRRRKEREGEGRPPAQARLRDGQRLREPSRLHEAWSYFVGPAVSQAQGQIRGSVCRLNLHCAQRLTADRRTR